MICYRVTDAVTLIRFRRKCFQCNLSCFKGGYKTIHWLYHPTLQRSTGYETVATVLRSNVISPLFVARQSHTWLKGVSALEPETFSTRARTITRCRSYCKGRVLVILSSRAIRSLVQRRLNVWVSVIKYLNSLGVQERTVETQKSKTEKALPCEDEWRLDGSQPLSIAR
ncbi:hypothetical protein FOXG_18567 [Fusarium oxysporum f. sp. lycopersici 4287]|uniref:Uncharacterized protein n=2 Tax=Fusarium oxysporum TaxID=5507 RepID=A0A0J9WJ46_FUSO4|nr:hypothetical protein FOXG_18567 [Fusarium oxysporum f. sp. lycopersici 4287]XP_018237693.1 hypothetical protein FOXG_18567 [Fusarium oxysporum f. sp. lycopersici 4287]XP_018237694.1 hypothetical protein FOXG_18567 [Fusarium oxysporum f. sp. lycopersici 4287]EXK31184.1 hypothetical protein FOMG_12936 [Fusarium oxysporum f. sp. melonis 26406]EXK31185.1 hypothetical protein FOMG_12936 [Fusarium oxysporum f. sp. melonis 26406]EXK31186.1 hypothetical protein FOMG_12936 [Fusarium oxysporum f. sp.